MMTIFEMLARSSFEERDCFIPAFPPVADRYRDSFFWAVETEETDEKDNPIFWILCLDKEEFWTVDDWVAYFGKDIQPVTVKYIITPITDK